MTVTMLTVEQAYDAMVRFLEHEYEFTKGDDLAGLLGSLSRDIWADRGPGDPGAWEDWLQAVGEVVERGQAPKATSE